MEPDDDGSAQVCLWASAQRTSEVVLLAPRHAQLQVHLQAKHLRPETADEVDERRGACCSPVPVGVVHTSLAGGRESLEAFEGSGPPQASAPWSAVFSPSRVALGSIHLLPGCRDRRAGPGRDPSSWPAGPSLSAPCVQPLRWPAGTGGCWLRDGSRNKQRRRRSPLRRTVAHCRRRPLWECQSGQKCSSLLQ